LGERVVFWLGKRWPEESNLGSDTKTDVSSHKQKAHGKGKERTPLSKLGLIMKKRIDQLQTKVISQRRHSLVVVGLVQKAFGYSLSTTKSLLKPSRSPLEEPPQDTTTRV